ncbi:hypothetical protein [Tateyamaria pelophila]|uniref:hypothetical protein n=1 Tax=Tateyamaria pelophila TaxID=328415 RepID=UPI001CBD19A5|nr:hypothetical protein [Tateyamaria pelophila]
MEKVFRLRDLATKTVTAKAGGGIGSVGLLGPDQDPDDFTPITPVVMVIKHKAQLDYIDGFKNRVEDIELETLDRTATEIGRAVVGSKFVGTALCTADMPTCAQNQRISPVASFAETVTSIDLAILRTELEHTLKMIDRLEG